MAFVGNGFDIQVMKDYASPIDTRYESFYHFLKLRSFNEENLIFKEMGILQRNNKKNWSDVESIVGELLSSNRAEASQLNEDLRDIQVQFSEFLELAVPNSLLANIGNESMDRSLAVTSLKGFLGDLSAEEYRAACVHKSSALPPKSRESQCSQLLKMTISVNFRSRLHPESACWAVQINAAQHL